METQRDLLIGLTVGAPLDLFNTQGQNWGLTTFSPRAMRTQGFAAFLEMLRAVMATPGGVRIDHVLGLMRLWVVPEGAGGGWRLPALSAAGPAAADCVGVM